ncbi:MAG: hypothetical protein ACXWLW_02680 [Rhizomicrobium sp.]
MRSLSIALDQTEVAAPTPLQKLIRLAGRYTLSALGPVSISAAHFLGAVLILHTLSRQHFGLFSFVMTIVPFCISAASALIGAPTTIGIRNRGHVDDAELATFQKANLVLAVFACAVVFVSLLASGLRLEAALLFGLYGALMSLRWLGRVYAYATNAPARATISDIAYSVLVVAGLATLHLLDRMMMTYIAALFSFAALASMMVFDGGYLRKQLRPLAAGKLCAYAPVWRDLTRWSLLGVAATELTVNAHAYFVTFFSGPGAFALLALGSLLMRPVSLILAAFPEMERPVMARAIGAKDLPRAFRAVKEFRTAGIAVLLVTVLLAAVLLFWFPQIVLKQGYDAHQAMLIVALWIAIMATRVLRTPEAVFLQAAGAFQLLANASLKSCAVSLAATLALLLAFGPIASLLGIVAGDVVLTASIFGLVRGWRLQHG